jgi:BCCT, betaine/carnitine/choline family transporter
MFALFSPIISSFLLSSHLPQFFIIFVAFRFGHVRLGPQDSKPEFSDYSYFAMLFSAGIGVGVSIRAIDEKCGVNVYIKELRHSPRNLHSPPLPAIALLLWSQ